MYICYLPLHACFWDVTAVDGASRGFHSVLDVVVLPVFPSCTLLTPPIRHLDARTRARRIPLPRNCQPKASYPSLSKPKRQTPTQPSSEPLSSAIRPSRTGKGLAVDVVVIVL